MKSFSNIINNMPIVNKTQPKIVILSNKKYPIKSFYNSVIPLNIFQTWHTKHLPPGMKQSTEYIKRMNPRFKYHLFDDNDCHDFIRDNFDVSVLNAFNKLIPGAYKADLWRYCVLYKLGGIYLDIKYIPANGFRFINLTETEHWVLDLDDNGIYNALLVCKAGNSILLSAINKIVENTQTHFYGSNVLEPTGPKLLAKFFNSNEKQKMDMKHNLIDNNLNNRIILFKKYIILKSYNGYLNESKREEKIPHYSILWNNKNIYN